jgi:hypothetical protein
VKDEVDTALAAVLVAGFARTAHAATAARLVEIVLFDILAREDPRGRVVGDAVASARLM